MKINVGSKNPIKVEAVRETLQDYPEFKDAEIQVKDVLSAVGDQPKSLEETVQGAMNRAQNAFEDCKYSFGLESGLMAVPYSKSGFMDVCVCAIFDGVNYHLGLSSAWEAPDRVMKLILEEGLNMNDAALKAGLTEDLKVGSGQGLIGIVTGGRLNRKAYTKQSIVTAMIHLEK